jgi:hypothetical protein
MKTSDGNNAPESSKDLKLVIKRVRTRVSTGIRTGHCAFVTDPTLCKDSQYNTPGGNMGCSAEHQF